MRARARRVERLIGEDGARRGPAGLSEFQQRVDRLALRVVLRDVQRRVGVVVAVVQHRGNVVGAVLRVPDHLVGGLWDVHVRPRGVLLPHLLDPLVHVLCCHAALHVEGGATRARALNVLLGRLHPAPGVRVLPAERQPEVLVVIGRAKNGGDLGTPESAREDRCGAPVVAVRWLAPPVRLDNAEQKRLLLLARAVGCRRLGHTPASRV